MKIYLTPLLIVVISHLYACSTLDEDLIRYEGMSCYNLAKEIGRWEYKLERAGDDADSAAWDDIFADNNDEENEATADAIAADWSQDEARAYLRELRRIEYEKDCR